MNHVSIIQNINNNSKHFRLQFSKGNELFLRSIVSPMLLDGASMNDSFKTIDFYADSVISLQKAHKNMSYNTVIHLIWYLSKQQEFLKKNGYGFYCLHLKDILVIDDCKFICMNPDNVNIIHNESESESFTFYSPFNRDGFMSPEILEINSIPATISYRCFYYSLGALGIHCLFGINISDYGKLVERGPTNIDPSHLVYNKILDILTPIKNTKLYWFFLKSLCVDHEKRSILFI